MKATILGLVTIAVMALLPGGCAATASIAATSCRHDKAISWSETLRAPDGAPLYLLTRGEHCKHPILLWLHGGPGGAERPLFQLYDGDLEKHFVVAYWDQRGAGRSYDDEANPKKLTIAQHLADMDIVVDHLRTALHRNQVILVGHSWGSALGLLYAQHHPDKVAAFVGVAQFVSGLANQQGQYAFAMKEAESRQDKDAENTLADIGRPPYSAEDELRLQDLVDRFGGLFHNRPGFLGAMVEGILYGYVTPWEIGRFIHANDVSLDAMNDELLKLDLRQTTKAVSVPVIFMEGRYDRQVDPKVAASYFEELEAPEKRLIWFDHSAHNIPFEEPETFQVRLTQALAHLRDQIGKAEKGEVPASILGGPQAAN